MASDAARWGANRASMPTRDKLCPLRFYVFSRAWPRFCDQNETPVSAGAAKHPGTRMTRPRRWLRSARAAAESAGRLVRSGAKSVIGRLSVKDNLAQVRLRPRASTIHDGDG